MISKYRDKIKELDDSKLIFKAELEKIKNNSHQRESDLEKLILFEKQRNKNVHK